MIALAIAGCSSTSSTSTSPGSSPGGSEAAGQSGGTFIDGAQLYADNLTSYDPGQVQTLDESQVTTALYDGLTDFDFSNKEKPVLKPLVAEKWEANSDATEFTFTIKKDQVFSNGDPVLPSSFKYAWNRNGQKDFASPYGYFIKYVKGGAELQEGTATDLGNSVVADDTAMTLKVTLSEPEADFPAIVSHPFFGPLPEKEVSKLTDQTQWDKGIMIGNGPFKMKQPKNDQEVILVRNDKWGGNVLGDKSAKLDEIDFKISKDPQSGYAAYQAGDVMSSTIPSGQYADAMQYPNTTKSPTLGSYYFDFGFTDPQLMGDKNLKLRQAISLIVDRDEINAKVYENTRTIGTGIVMPGIPGFKEGLCKYCKRDADQAKKLFAEWKSAGGSLSGPITVDFNTGGGHEDVVAIIQNNLKELGIETTTNPVSEKYFSKMPAEGGCHFCRAGWYADYPAYSTFMVDLFSSASLEGNNMGHFSDEKFDAMLKQARATTDDQKRYEIYQQAESYLLNDVTATVPLNWYNGDQVYSDKVTGYDQPPLGIILWERVALKS